MWGNIKMKAQNLITIRLISTKQTEGLRFFKIVSITVWSEPVHIHTPMWCHKRLERSKSMHLETRMCGWCHHWAPMGRVPLCTCNHMAYLLDTSFTSPQGTDCSEAIWLMGPMMHISPLFLPSCTQLATPTPPPCPHQTAPTLPWAEGLFQLLSKLRSSSSTAVEAPCDLLSSPTAIHNTPCTSCVWVLLKRCSTYIRRKKSTLLSFVVLHKEGFLAARCGIATICF